MHCNCTNSKKNNSHYAVNAISHHWILKTGPPQYLNLDGGTEHFNSEMSYCCFLFNIRHFPRNSHAPWTNQPVEVQNKKLGTHLRNFLHDTSENWSIRVHFIAYAHNSQPLWHQYLSTYEKFFHTQPRIPLNFQKKLSRTSVRECTTKYCYELPPHSLYQSAVLNPSFHSFMLKPVSTLFLAIETD